jgi:ketosteroid isomerase-like protein
MTASSLTPERTRISDSGDMAFSVGSTSNEFRGPEGLVTYRGKFVLIWTRRDGDWLISAYAISGNQAPVE